MNPSEAGGVMNPSAIVLTALILRRRSERRAYTQRVLEAVMQRGAEEREMRHLADHLAPHTTETRVAP